MIGRWDFKQQPLANHKQGLFIKTIQEIVAPKAATHSPYSFWNRAFSHDVTAATLVFQPVLWELNSFRT